MTQWLTLTMIHQVMGNIYAVDCKSGLVLEG